MPGDAIIYENESLNSDWKFKNHHFSRLSTPETTPAGVTKFVEKVETLDEVKAAKDFTVIGMFPCTRTPDGIAAVLFSQRGADQAFGGKWGAYGGTLGAYVNVMEFAMHICQKECGLALEPEVLMGIYRVCAPDRLQSITEIAYAAYAPYHEVMAQASAKPDHAGPKLVTLKELDSIDTYWSARRIAQRALLDMPYFSF